MLVDQGMATAYARKVLETGPAISRILRETLDPSAGEFVVTDPFLADRESYWYDTRRTDPPEEREPSRGDGLTARLLPLLKDDRAVILGSAYVEPRTGIETPIPPTRIVYNPVEGGFESHYLVPGPQHDPESLAGVVHASQGMHHAVGALVDLAGAKSPEHGDIVTEATLRRLLARVAVAFMRMTSYDGYLIWERK